MIYINPAGVSAVADKMNEQVKKLVSNSDEFEMIKRTLSEMSGMEKIIAELTKLQRNIEKSGATMYRMGNALKEISEGYNHCEKDIISNTDNSKVIFNLEVRGVNDFTPIRNLISDLKFI